MKFNDDMIQRSRIAHDGPLPQDAFELIHDLAYDHEGRDREQYKERAQKILMLKTEEPDATSPNPRGAAVKCDYRHKNLQCAGQAKFIIKGRALCAAHARSVQDEAK